MSTRLRRLLTRTAVLAAATVLLAGCGGDATPATQPDQSKVVAELRNMLPEEITKDNKLDVATSLYPPVDYYESDGKTLTGFDYEIMEAIAERLGVTIKWHVIDFAAIIPGIESGQYDLATDVNDTAEREKVVDFVTEFRDGTSILVPKGNPKGLSDLASLCGHTVVVTKGSTQIALIDKQNASCEQPITRMEVPDDPDAMLAMRNGRADAYLVNTLAGSYAVEKGGQEGFELLPGVYDEVYAGLVFPKHATQLRDAMRAAMQSIIDDGTYDRIMDSYGLSRNKIDKALVNAATS